MQRFTSMVAAITLILAPSPARSRPPSDSETASIAFVNAHRVSTGGFASEKGKPASLGATAPALRAIKYFSGTVDDVDAHVRFVLSCQDASGGFADAPGGKPSVGLTASGLMALAELDAVQRAETDKILAYFAANAKTDGDVYIAAASLDAARIKPRHPEPWIDQTRRAKSAAGGFGADLFSTAGGAITILRLGGTLDDPKGIAAMLKKGQRDDGGFSARPDAPSDLSATYRIARALRMLHAAPDIPKCRQFIASCRNADGGYGVRPGEPSAIGPTYFASIVLHWLEEAEAKSAK
jgi:hypothetical protein